MSLVSGSTIEMLNIVLLLSIRISRVQHEVSVASSMEHICVRFQYFFVLIPVSWQ